MLTYSVALGSPEDVHVPDNEVSGWLLKKKRKRMQGWAKRWFTLSHTGVLSYSTSQGGVTRGSIQILVSTVSYSPNLRLINIDSGTMIYHLKSLTESDYDQWLSALTEVRRTNGEVVDNGELSFQEEYNKSKISLSSKRLSSRYNDNKKIRAEIEQGLDTSNLHQQNTELLAGTVRSLKEVLMVNDLGAVQALMEKLDHQTLQMVTDAKEQISQWKNVQTYYQTLSHRRSGSISPIAPMQAGGDDTIHEDYEVLHRTSSIYSGYSDQFFDAQDIELSGGEEEEDDLINNDDTDEDDNDSNGK
jgi:hypothetical protein